MTNHLVGDVYAKIIEGVIAASAGDFEESGVGQGTLQALQQEWHIKLSQRGVAQMPWDPRQQASAPVAQQHQQHHISNANGLPPVSHPQYEPQAPAVINNGPRIKAEPGTDAPYNVASNGHAQNTPAPQGGIARAKQLVQAQWGSAASASLNAMQSGGLALPGQQQSDSKPHDLQLPRQMPPQAQQQYIAQQQQQQQQQHLQAVQRQQQHVMQQQQGQPYVKTEDGSADFGQGTYDQALPNYSQTDGADDSLEEWKNLLAERRAISNDQRQRADRMIRDHVMQTSSDLQSGLMLPLDDLLTKVPQSRGGAALASSSRAAASSAAPAIPQLDGDIDDDEKPDIRDEDDENAINSDLDDSDDNGGGPAGEDDDDLGDEVLCTYDKVQRVKNKWKCTLKDGIMSSGGKDWVFHKGMGEFEW